MTTTPAACILIVEDERIVAKDLQQTLAKLGYDVRPPVSSAEAAIASAAERCPGLVLMDVRIKGRRDGIETAHILQREFGVPVVYLTAYADDATLERAKRTQPYGYLVKPVRPTELRSVIEMALYRHEMDKRSRERERASAGTLRSMGDAVIAVDLAGKVTYLNPAAERLTRRASSDLVGQPIREIVRALESGELPAGSPSPPLPEPRSSGIRELAPARSAAEDRDSAAQSEPLQEGPRLGSVMVLRDVPEQQLAQKQQELSDRLASMQTLASGVAHEVNNSLAAVLTNAEFVLAELRELRAEQPSTSPSHGVLARLDDLTRAQSELQAGARRIHAVMADLKAFSHPVEPATGEADVRRALGWALHATARELGGRARLTTRLAELPAAQADEAQLGIVLAHLLANAAQAIPAGDPEHHEVRVSAHPDASGDVVIEIRDSGVGMTPEIQQHAFEPFFTTNSAGTRRGLGLAICHGLIRSAGGDIQVESKPGEGSTFRIRLPQAVRRAPSLSPLPPWSERPRHARILVVDDNDLVCKSILRILREQDVAVAEDGEQALKLLQSSQPFDLILTDVVMPRMGGIELYETLLASDPDLARRVVFMSGGTLTARADDFFRAVRNRRIEKPFTSAQLLDVVQQSLADRASKTAVS